MSRANAAHALPPGDRDEAPVFPGSASATEQVELFAAAGRETDDIGRRIAAIATSLDTAQLAIADVRLMLKGGNLALAEAAARRLSEALMIDLRVVSHELGRAIARRRREHITQTGG